jgi:hypothetical protein
MRHWSVISLVIFWLRWLSEKSFWK